VCQSTRGDYWLRRLRIVSLLNNIFLAPIYILDVTLCGFIFIPECASVLWSPNHLGQIAKLESDKDGSRSALSDCVI